MTDHVKRRLVDQTARRRLTARLVDFTTIDDAKGRVRRSPDATKLDPLGNERAGNENQPLRNFLFLLRGLTCGSSSERGGREGARGQENGRKETN